MPLIYVHGVNVRVGTGYRQEEKDRDILFRQILLADADGRPYNGSIRNPYWGSFGAKFRWNQASVPAGAFTHLGTSDSLTSTLLMEMARPEEGDEGDTILSDIARVSLPDAVDLLIAVSLDSADDSRRSRLAEFARVATTYAVQNPQPAWVVAGQSNDDFVESLITRVESCAPTPTDASALS